MAHTNPIEKLALFAALTAVFDACHPAFDQYPQTDRDACGKGSSGPHLVYTADGVPVGEEKEDRTGWRTATATRFGWECAARHVAAYTAGQTLTTALVLRALGQRPSARALAASALINGTTHLVFDRREPLKRVAKLFGKDKYLEHCTAVRKIDAKEAADTGPGTALFELDQAAHRFVGVAAALVATLLT